LYQNTILFFETVSCLVWGCVLRFIAVKEGGGSGIVFRVLLFIAVTAITYLGTKLSFIGILFLFLWYYFSSCIK
jgi:hypothetical protein